jgi:hypothetical protein
LPTNRKQAAMRQALVNGYLDADSPTKGLFAPSVLAAGYSETSLRVRRAKYKRWIEIERKRRQPAQAPSVESVADRRSPVSGQRLPAWYSGESASAPTPQEVQTPRQSGVDRLAEFRADAEGQAAQRFPESVNLSSFGHDNIFTKRSGIVKFDAGSYRAKRRNLNGESVYE